VVIESALSAPRTSWRGKQKYATLEAKAAALVYALAKSQACVDGNKRIALILLRVFLYVNGFDHRAAPGEKAKMILYAAASDASQREAVLVELTAWIRKTIEPLGGET
jgi:death on curing protein